jgi:superfamily II DNA or RNA helicase
MESVHLQYINAVHCKVVTEPSILMELSDHFTFFAENYRFNPRYKARVWDGKIRLVNRLTALIYAGLARHVKKFCDERGYAFTYDEQLQYDNISADDFNSFITNLGLPDHIRPRDYQIKSVVKCIKSKRRTLLSPTSSGKSLMIYMITQWYKKKTLIVVPTIGLVKQMAEDFREYGYTGSIHMSTDGLSTREDIQEDIVITTWQSMNNGRKKMARQWYQQFEVVVGDEAHTCKATSLVKILTSLDNCKYRFGTTGTLDDTPLNKITIEGLFGPQYQVVTTKDLMDSGHVSNLKIKCIVLKYPEQICKDMKGKTYHEEIDFITSDEDRVKFIKNLTLSLKGNKLLFFRVIDHGKQLADVITSSGASNVFYIDGSVSGTNRNDIRKAIEEEENAILVASLGTTSTGISINKLHHMIAASPSKSKIKVLQSIGRMLRQHESKEQAVLYDIVDDFSYKSYTNFTYKHFIDRTRIYDKEQFDYKIYTVTIKSS